MSLSLSLSPSRFQPSSSSFSKLYDFFPLTSVAFLTPVSLAQPSFPPFSLDPGRSPCAYTCRPKLESNFPHHIPQKLLRGARRGRKQRDARLSYEGTTEHFYLLFASLFPLSSLSLPRAVRSKTISEHIARIRLRSLPFSLPHFSSPIAGHARRCVPLIRPSWRT